MPSRAPARMVGQVNSGGDSSGGMNGWWAGAWSAGPAGASLPAGSGADMAVGPWVGGAGTGSGRHDGIDSVRDAGKARGSRRNTLTLMAIPTNLITGFLGVGKTTAVIDLLSRKPPGSRWAVLVNEYGDVSIDGAMIEGETPDGVSVREVGGGCVCCANAPYLPVALHFL